MELELRNYHLSKRTVQAADTGDRFGEQVPNFVKE
jgi:hypothetical protein